MELSSDASPSPQVLFVSAQRLDEPFGLYSEGIAVLSAELKASGHSTDLFVVTRRVSDPEFEQVLRHHAPAVVAFSILSPEWPLFKRLIRVARESTGAYLVAGGCHPTFAPEQVLGDSQLDALCVGEGDGVFTELVEAVLQGRSPTRLPGFWFRDRHRGTVVRHAVRPPVQHLDALPDPDRALYRSALQSYRDPHKPWQRFDPQRMSAIPMRASRGCAHRCTYCANAGLLELYGGVQAFVRRRSPQSLAAEIERVSARDPTQQLLFFDESFPLSTPWLAELAQRLERIERPGFTIAARPGRLTAERVSLLRRAGCQMVSMGVECGDEQYRRDMLGRQETNEQLRSAFSVARQGGLQTLAFVMLGLPDEADDQLEQSLTFLEELAPDVTATNLFVPLPGSHLFEVCRQRGLLRTADESDPDPLRNIRHVRLSPSALERACHRLGMDVGHHKPMVV